MIRRLTVDVPRILLGLLFVFSAVDGFLWIFTGQNLIHPPTSDIGLRVEAALKESGFVWPLMKSIDLLAGLALLFNRAPALALLALLPIITVIGMELPMLIGGAVIVEQVFSWPGLGLLTMAAIMGRDYPVIMGVSLLSAVMVLLGNLVTDILYAVVDPTIQLK